MLALLPFLSALLDDQAEGALIRRLQAREPQAVADLYDRYGRPCFGLILRVVRNESIAEDLVQETFLRVWNRVHAFNPERGGLGPWILAVARNRAIDYLRSVDGRMARNALEIDKMEEPMAYSGLEEELLNLDRVKLLKNAFAKLSAQQKQVLELAYYEGLSQTEMAERLNQPLGTVKTWVRSALRILREQLGAAASA